MQVPQTEDELNSHLREQIDFLRRSSQAYDEGFASEAKRLATVIRVLLHDTRNSTSLLTLLRKKDILFHDTSLGYDPRNKVSTMGLIMIRVGPDGASYVPPLDDGPPIRYSKAKIAFEEWWNKIVFVDTRGNELTRKDLVLAVSNKDGGAHVDPQLNSAYAALTRFNSLGWKLIQNGIEKDFATKPELASIRQMSHEVLKSLKDEFPEYF